MDTFVATVPNERIKLYMAWLRCDRKIFIIDIGYNINVCGKPEEKNNEYLQCIYSYLVRMFMVK